MRHERLVVKASDSARTVYRNSTILTVCRLQGFAVDELYQLAQPLDSPPPRNQPQRRLLELGQKKRRRGGVHAFGFAAGLLGVDWVEVDEPAFEKGLGD